MIHEIWWSLPLTLAVYFASRRLAQRLHTPLGFHSGDYSASATGRHPTHAIFRAVKFSMICCNRR